ncbi:enhancer of split mbeta protein [Osmia lignaria lignaria]|uniref:enhancer of split mbeta protein n=1 Tax=Osmia lignaria lignaria TaxID=1437193 RepID=UPI00402B7005
MMSYEYPHPVSRTYQYKKITKPLLERKRRARINKCLDELKSLMIDALETEGEDISKLEKADILELTVRHLQRLQGSQSSGTIATNDEVSAESRWLSGFGHCAAEAYRFLSALPGEGAERLARHLAAGLQKSRQTNSSLKTNILTQILANLNLTVDLVTPPLGNPVEDSRVTSTNQNAINYPGAVRDGAFNLPTACNSVGMIDKKDTIDRADVSEMKDSREQRAAKRIKTEVRAEDDEEIDVERVDETDPMWRPW